MNTKTKAKKEWVIQSDNEYDDDSNECLCWNTEDGWVSEGYATIFSDYEMETYTDIPDGGRWIMA